MPLAAIARRALAHLDLTELSDTCQEDHVEVLIGKALSPIGKPAAVCVWPQHVSLCRKRLGGRGIGIATVVNFPKGGEDIERAIEDVEEALSDGADEIDLVLPCASFLSGNSKIAGAMIRDVKSVLPPEALLKVILETGALREAGLIRAAADLAIANGADFIKTSTGKTPVSATPEAVATMLQAIKESGRDVGIKPSGGIRTLEDAARYLDMAELAMGADWVTPRHVRLGASSLHDAIVKGVSGGSSPPDAPQSY
jgi:deoxyribose-phosphate aldolase